VFGHVGTLQNVVVISSLRKRRSLPLASIVTGLFGEVILGSGSRRISTSRGTRAVMSIARL